MSHIQDQAQVLANLGVIPSGGQQPYSDLPRLGTYGTTVSSPKPPSAHIGFGVGYCPAASPYSTFTQAPSNYDASRTYRPRHHHSGPLSSSRESMPSDEEILETARKRQRSVGTEDLEERSPNC